MNYELRLKIKKFAAFSFFAAFLFPGVLYAADFNFISEKSEYVVGDEFEVNLKLSSREDPINAIEGDIVALGKLKIKEIRTGGSIVNFWIENPAIESGSISFAGVIPGGYLGDNGEVISFVMQAVGVGSGSVELQNLRALIQDEDGSRAKINQKKLVIEVLPPTDTSKRDIVPNAEIIDTVPPEFSEPFVERYNEIFNGLWFVAFSAEDKESGVFRYEIQESKNSKPDDASWESAQNPYLLKDQSRGSYIHIRAYDRAGNSSFTTIKPQGGFLLDTKTGIIVIIILLLVVGGVYFLVSFFRRRQTNFPA